MFSSKLCLIHLMLQSQQKCALATFTRGAHLHIAAYHATIEIALCADQEPASSPPVRGTHQEKMKAPRQQASSHYRLSVNSTQASVGQMRVEFGWRAFFEEGRLEVELKEIVVGLRDPDQKEKTTWQPLAWLKKAVCVFCVYSYMAAWLCVFVGRQRHVQVTQIELDVTEVVHIQGHWIIIPSIYQARQLFNTKSNKSQLKCQEMSWQNLWCCWSFLV